jgi:tetratricopeptide (TPR) repeat protein
MYLARAVITGAAWFSEKPVDFETPGGGDLALHSVRALSVLVSLATLVALWHVARTTWDERTALLAVVLVGAVPLVLQQAHFYTVDGPFALLALLALGAVLRLEERSGPGPYLVAGLLIGATAATRLNGLLTAIVLTTAHLSLSHHPGWQRLSQSLRVPELWYASLATVATLLALQPYLLTDPESMLRALNTNDFAYSVAIARGDLLRPWSLADMHTTPYLHFWTALWPQGAGWPLTLLLAAGWLHAVVRGGRSDRLVALWCALFFLTIGGLHTKHVRYLLPLVAPLGLLAARMVVDLCARRWRARWVMTAVAACTLYTWFYGVAFNRIYRLEDARTSAGRWLQQHVPAGAVIAIERGGFSMRGTFRPTVHPEQDLNTTTIFASRGYLTCGAAARYLSSRLEGADWVAITDVNRYRQYTAAARMYPVLASFYENLLQGHLGFESAQRFKIYPQVAGWTFNDDDAEPSFLGFDHPAVYVLRQTSHYRTRMATWKDAAPILPGCADRSLEGAVQAMLAGDLDGAEVVLEDAGKLTPGLSHLIQVMVHERRGDPVLAQASMRLYSAGGQDRSRATVLLPWATATSLAELGLESEAVRILELGWERRSSLGPGDREIMAKSYMYVAAQLSEAGRGDLEERVSLMAVDLWESPSTLNSAAQLVYDRGAEGVALALWEKSLSMDDRQTDIHFAASTAAAASNDWERASHHIHSAAEQLLTADTVEAPEAIKTAAQSLHRLGESEQALAYLRRAGERYPASEAHLQATADSLSVSGSDLPTHAPDEP